MREVPITESVSFVRRGYHTGGTRGAAPLGNFRTLPWSRIGIALGPLTVLLGSYLALLVHNHHVRAGRLSNRGTSGAGGKYR